MTQSLPQQSERFVIHEQIEGWYIRDTETGDRLPYEHHLGGAFFIFRPLVEQVAAKLNAVATTGKERPHA